MTRYDQQRLSDIVSAITAIRGHLRRGDLSDGLVFDAVRIRILDIGEAVNALPPQLLTTEPTIPWRQIAVMRDQLAHRYFDTSHAIVTATVGTDLDELEAAVSRLVVQLEAVRDAYSSMSTQYIGMVGDGLQEHPDDMSLVRRHLADVAGPVLDLGCGPGHWTAYLHSLGVDVTGVDMVPEFVAHARATYPGLTFVQGSMTDVDVPDNTVAGILSWYSTIHLSPSGLDVVLADFHRLLAPGGTLVVGFFDSDDGVAPFDHKVITAYRWPADEFSARLTRAGFTHVERVRRHVPERPDRRYAAIAARTT